jgi:L-fucose mutarotase
MEKGKCMLKTLTQLHSPELLHTLAAGGHGDELALVDAHFPAVSMARRLIRLDGADPRRAGLWASICASTALSG